MEEHRAEIRILLHASDVSVVDERSVGREREFGCLGGVACEGVDVRTVLVGEHGVDDIGVCGALNFEIEGVVVCCWCGCWCGGFFGYSDAGAG